MQNASEQRQSHQSGTDKVHPAPYSPDPFDGPGHHVDAVPEDLLAIPFHCSTCGQQSVDAAYTVMGTAYCPQCGAYE